MANEFLTRNEEIVDGMYRLGAVIRRSTRSTVYETEFGQEALPAAIKIRESESVADSENLLKRWRNALELAHPNLLKVYAAGSSVLNDVPIVYVVMERANESLENVLTERALTEDETREILMPALAALKHLHKMGYAHAHLSASNVLAVDDQLKLSSDSATSVSGGAAAAEDMSALGGLIVQALTQKVADPGGNLDPYIFREIPQPFSDIVRRCLNPDSVKRWTVEQVEARLQAPAVASVLQTDVVQTGVEQANLAQPSVEAQAAAPPKQHERDAARSPGGIPKWIYAGLAALVLIVVLVAVMRKKDSTPEPVTRAAVVTQQPEPRSPQSAPSHTARPAPPAEATPDVSRARGRKADGWSVIVATYNSREAAEKRLRAMTKRWPRFNVSVFRPQSESGHYIVGLGQNLSEDQAEALRKRAVASGLPRDTYIKRLM